MPDRREDSATEPRCQEVHSRPAERNQLDLFVALPGDLPTHDQQEMMERPFFSLSKGKRLEPIDYRVRNGTTEIRVRVTANAETGMATIWDADVLIWAQARCVRPWRAGFQLHANFASA